LEKEFATPKTELAGIPRQRDSGVPKAPSRRLAKAASAPLPKTTTSAGALQRRYQPGEKELVQNAQSQWVNNVNRPYCTVTRCDTITKRRADADGMESLHSQRGKVAAICASQESLSGQQQKNSLRDNDHPLNESERSLQVVPFGCAACAQHNKDRSVTNGALDSTTAAPTQNSFNDDINIDNTDRSDTYGGLNKCGFNKDSSDNNIYTAIDADRFVTDGALDSIKAAPPYSFNS
jgi:hypothetical protein